MNSAHIQNRHDDVTAITKWVMIMATMDHQNSVNKKNRTNDKLC